MSLLRWYAFLWTVLIAGCATSQQLEGNLYKGSTTASIGVNACYTGVDKADEIMQDKIREKAKTDKPGAQADFDKWKPERAKAMKGCNVIQMGVQDLTASIPLIIQLYNTKKAEAKAKAIELLAKFLALGAEVAANLKTIGIEYKLPGIGGL